MHTNSRCKASLAVSSMIDMAMAAVQVYEFNVPTFGKGVVFDVDHKVRLWSANFAPAYAFKISYCDVQ